MIGAAAAAMRTAEGADAGKAVGKMPTIRLGKLKVSRLILGSNPFFGFAHRGGKKLQAEMKAYYTDERIMELLEAAAGLGVTAVAAPPYDRWIKLFGRYVKSGGKLRTWIAQPDPPGEKMVEAIEAAVEGGAKAIFIQGGCADEHFGWKRFDVIEKWLKLIRRHKLPAGLASHRHDTHPEYERRGLPTDFCFQCFFRPVQERYELKHRDLAVATLKTLDKPVVGYKILAAGRLPADEAFAFAFKHLRSKDGLCVGIYEKERPDILRQDAAFTAARGRL